MHERAKLGEYKEILERNCSDISFDNIAHFYNSYGLKSLVKFSSVPLLPPVQTGIRSFYLLLPRRPSERTDFVLCKCEAKKDFRSKSSPFRVLEPFAFSKRGEQTQTKFSSSLNVELDGIFMLHFHCYVDVQILLSHSIHFLILKRFLIGR